MMSSIVKIPSLAVLVHHAEPLFVLLKMLQLLKIAVSDGMKYSLLTLLRISSMVKEPSSKVMQRLCGCEKSQDVVQFAIVHRQFIVVAGHQLMDGWCQYRH